MRALVALSGVYGLLVSEGLVARRLIGTSTDRPPSADGIHGARLPGRPLRCLVLGDSAAVGFGMTAAQDTPAALIGAGLSTALGRPVHVHSEAEVGVRTAGLTQQIDRGLSHRPDLAVIIVGTNDVVRQVPPRRAAGQLADVVDRLSATGCVVVVGTCPDLGAVRPIPQPLRWVIRCWSRHLARLQTIAVVEAGGRTVSLGGLLGPVFIERSDVMFGSDRFHPSETGYANMVSVLIPAMTDGLRDSHADDPDRQVMSLHDAAGRASQRPGTDVVRTGRRTSIRRRRAA